MIGRLERVDLRKVWPHEALDFTRWLEENYEILNDVLDVNLGSAERELSAGNFSVDLVAEDDNGNIVVIENQLGRSDHDHLGKILTYLSSLEAKTAIWIVSDPRPEHVKAITWLNETSPAAFYMIKAEAVRIGGSPPAPLLTVIVGPSAESRQVGDTKKDLAERHHVRLEFWQQLLDRAAEKTNLHAGREPTHVNWISTGVGISGLTLNYVIREHDVQVELYIDRGKGRESENEAIFDQLFEQRKTIESAFGDALDWQRLEAKRARRVRYVISLGGYRDTEKWSEIQAVLIDAMIRFEAAMRPHVQQVRV